MPAQDVCFISREEWRNTVWGTTYDTRREPEFSWPRSTVRRWYNFLRLPIPDTILSLWNVERGRAWDAQGNPPQHNAWADVFPRWHTTGDESPEYTPTSPPYVPASPTPSELALPQEPNPVSPEDNAILIWMRPDPNYPPGPSAWDPIEDIASSTPSSPEIQEISQSVFEQD